MFNVLRSTGLWWNPQFLKPSFLDFCHNFKACMPLHNRPTAPQGHTHFVRYPTLSMDCGWDFFHPLNQSVIFLQSLENATARFLWQVNITSAENLPGQTCARFWIERNFQANTVTQRFCQDSQTPCIYYHINIKPFHFLSFGKYENDIIKALMQLKEFLGVCDKEIALFSV